MRYCNCTLAGKALGDGCEVCNPGFALEIANDRIKELEEAILQHKQGIEMRFAASFKKPAYEDKLLWAVLQEQGE